MFPFVTVPTRLLDDARALLRELCGPAGIRASSSSAANYGAVFARDAVMAGLAGLLLGDSKISGGLARTLEHLRALQGREGQIASNYEMAGTEVARVSFGSLVPRLDAPLWYVVGVAVASRAAALDPEPYRASVRLVIRLQETLEYNGRHLLYVPVGGDWADEYVYDGYVLHDQVLRAWALRMASDVFGEPSWRVKSSAIAQAIETGFWTADAVARGYPPAAFTPARTHDMFDLATTSLLATADIAPAMATSTLDWVANQFLARGELPPAFHPVIDESHPDWPALGRYHLHGFRNRPFEYHNGGIWPVWLGWLALALARHGRDLDLARLQAALGARLDAPVRYDFEEFLHGRTGAPGGMARMAYSATGVLLLHVASAPARLSLLD